MTFIDGLVSVIVPTYGRCQYLPRAIESVLKQSYDKVEIIVVDDNGVGSGQGGETARVMSRFVGHPNVRYIRHDENKNGSSARNTGFANSKGEYVAYLDDDDEFEVEKIALQLDSLRHHHDFEGVYTLTNKYYHGKLVQESKYSKTGNCLLDVLSLRSVIHTSSLLFRREVLVELDGWDEAFVRHQDYEFLVRYFERFNIFCVAKPLVRINVESTINRPDVDRLIVAKEVFFGKFASLIEGLPAPEQVGIFKAHNLEVFRVCIKQLDLRAIRYLYKAKPTLSDLRYYVAPVILNYIKRIGF